MDATWLDRKLSRFRRREPLHSGRSGLKVVHTQAGELRVRSAGAGRRCLVFVCDSPAFIEHHDALFARLQTDFRVLCIELPGMGFSLPSPRFDFSLGAQAQAVSEVLAAERVDDAVLAFGCVNAYLTILLADALPHVVRGVVMMQAPSWAEEQRWARRIDFRGRGVLAMPVVGQLLVTAAKGPLARRWFASALADPALAPQFAAIAERAFAAGSGWALASLTQAYFTGPAPQLRPVAQRALLVWGARDRTHRESDPRSGLIYLPRGELVCFEQSGHFPELEEPERFADLLSRFASDC